MKQLQLLKIATGLPTLKWLYVILEDGKELAQKKSRYEYEYAALIKDEKGFVIQLIHDEQLYQEIMNDGRNSFVYGMAKLSSTP